MIKLYLFSTLLALQVGLQVFAQNNPSDTSKAAIQALREQVEKGSYFTAIPALENIRKANPQNQKINQLLAEAYEDARQPEKAAQAYEAAYNPKTKGSAKLMLPIVQNYYNAGNYTKARLWVEQIDKRKDADGPTKTRAKALALSMDEMSRVDTISSRYAMDTSYKFPNSGYADFAPVRMNDSTLVFSSLRNDSVAYYDPALPNFNTTKVFVYRQSGSHFDNMEAPKILTPPGQHSGNGSFTPDGRHFYFSRCVEGENGKLFCAIYMAEVEKGKFKNVKKLDGAINKPGSSSSQPFVVTTTMKNTMIETLYFVSDRKGTTGGNDIWVSTYNPKKKKFGNAANLGRAVNTAGDEQSPFIDEATGNLYFSSNYHTGYGGQDVFLARKAGNSFGKPINVGKPVNSSSDDSYFRFDGREGAFICSNRKGAHELEGSICCEDVFYLKRLPKLDSVQWLAFQKAAREGIKPVVKPVEALVKEVPVQKPETIGETVVMETKPVAVAKEEVQVGKVDLKTKNDSKGVNKQTTNLMKAISQNIQFEAGSNRLTVATMPHLDSLASLLKQNKNYRLTLTGHTDSKGSKALNTKLSKTRAETVKAHLVAKGVEKNRIAIVAKGPLVPLFPNKKPDGSDNPEGRAKNRRVTLELKKLK